MKRRFLILLSLVVAVLIGVLAPVSAQGKSVTILYPQELDNLNPMYSNMYFSSITESIYLSGAWAFDADLNPVPVLVTEIPSSENGGVSEDGKVITLSLRDDIVWSDGTPITSADFLFTYEMMISENNIPNSRYPYGIDDGIIASVEAPDATTVVVNYVDVFAPWVTTLFTFVLPEHVLRPVFEADGTLDTAEWNRNPSVGSGPFVFAEWEVGSFMRFTRNENYYNDAALLDNVVLSFVPDSEAYVATLLNGDGDLGTFLAYSDIPTLEEAGFVPQFVASGYNEQWLLNIREGLGHPALQDALVRQAIVQAVNRDQINVDLNLDLTYTPSGFWEGTPYDSPNVTPPAFDPAAAAALLDEAGWVDSNGDGTRDKDGTELVLRYITNQRQIRVDMQAVVQQQLAEVGIGTELINYPSDIFFNGYAQGGPTAIGDYDIAQYSTTGSFPDPNTSVFLCSEIPTDENPEGANYRGICDPELDALFAEQARTTDFDARVALFHQIDEMIADTYTFVGIWYDPDLWVVAGRVQNSAVNGVDPFWNINQWDVTE